jgi:hypothetical protein
MTNSLLKSETLASKADVDSGLSDQFTENSQADLLQSGTLKEHAADLETDSLKEEEMAHMDLGKEKFYYLKASNEQAQADVLGLEAATDQKVYQEEIEKSMVESAKASKELARTESDAVTTGVCEVIPLIDFVCDFIGSIAAIGLESHAAQLTAESAIDASSATASKAEENELLAQMDALREEGVKDETVAAEYSGNAKDIDALVTQEKAEAAREEQKALELAQKSKEELSVAESEQVSATEEETKAASETDNAMEHGLMAIKDAILAGMFSFLSLAFFLFRFMMAVVLPGGAAIVGFIPYSTTLLESGRKVANGKEWIRNAWRVLPKREISFFLMHCSIFMVTMIGFSSQLATLDQVDVQSQGGIILCFATTAALIQSAVLHVLPLIVDISISSDFRNLLMTSMSQIMTELCRGLLYLFPLFLIEICELRLLSSKNFFRKDLRNFMNLTVLFGILICSGLILAFSWARDIHYNSNHTQSHETIHLFQDQMVEDKAYQTYDLEVCGSNINFYKDSVPSPLHRSDLRYGSIIAKNPSNLVVCTEIDDSTSVISQYIYDLKLPFELLVITVMFVKLRECWPIFALLLPGALKSHPHFLLDCGVVALLTLAVLWCLLSSSNMRYGHIGVWTGRLGRRFY